jgi:hypothetical protein
MPRQELDNFLDLLEMKRRGQYQEPNPWENRVDMMPVRMTKLHDVAPEIAAPPAPPTPMTLATEAQNLANQYNQYELYGGKPMGTQVDFATFPRPDVAGEPNVSRYDLADPAQRAEAQGMAELLQGSIKAGEPLPPLKKKKKPQMREAYFPGSGVWASHPEQMPLPPGAYRTLEPYDDEEDVEVTVYPF